MTYREKYCRAFEPAVECGWFGYGYAAVSLCTVLAVVAVVGWLRLWRSCAPAAGAAQ